MYSSMRHFLVLSWLFMVNCPLLLGQDMTTLEHHSDVGSYSVSPGGRYVVAFEAALPVGGYLPRLPGKGKMLVWDVATKANQVLAETLSMDGAVFSPESRSVATVHRRDREVRIWRKDGGRWISASVLPTPEAEIGVAVVFMPEFSKNGKEVFVPVWRPAGLDPSAPDLDEIQPTTNDDGGFLAGEATIERWDTTTAKRLPLPIPKGSHAFLSLAYCERERMLLAGTLDRVIAFDVATGAQRYLVRFPKGVGTVFVSPNEEYAAPSWSVLGFGYNDDQDDSLQLWRVSDGKVIWQTQLKKGGGIPIPTFSPDSKMLVFRTAGGTLQRYDIENSMLLPPVKELQQPEVLYYRHDGALMTAVADGRSVRLRKVGTRISAVPSDVPVPEVMVPLPDSLHVPGNVGKKQ
ncbi:MAG: WD40 repeat domain-containing protein [Pirellulales bacterium]